MTPAVRPSEYDKSAFADRMVGIYYRQRQDIRKYLSSFLEIDTMLILIRFCLSRIPFEIHVAQNAGP